MIICVLDPACPHEFGACPVVDFSHEWMCRHCHSTVRVSWRPGDAGKSYEDTVAELATELAEHTGWTFSGKPYPTPEPLTIAEVETLYSFLSLGPSVEWYADGRVVIDGVEVRESWWRRTLNAVWRRWTR